MFSKTVLKNNFQKQGVHGNKDNIFDFYFFLILKIYKEQKKILNLNNKNSFQTTHILCVFKIYSH